MANHGTYADLSSIKFALGISSTDTADDSRLLGILEDASRGIDGWCARWFQPRSQTRYYLPTNSGELLVDDLLAVTTLKTDEDGDRTYEYSWELTDYDLWPYNEWPKQAVQVTPDGDYTFPTGIAKGVEVAGTWGYGDGDSATPYADSTTDTAEELDASETAVDVVSGAVFSPGNSILVESEQMYVTAVATNTLTVIRGVNGTTAATHATGKDVYKYAYPRDIRRACIRLAQRTYRLESAPFGVSGGPADMGSVDVVASAGDRDIWGWLNPFRKLAVG